MSKYSFSHSALPFSHTVTTRNFTNIRDDLHTLLRWRRHRRRRGRGNGIGGEDKKRK